MNETEKKINFHFDKVIFETPASMAGKYITDVKIKCEYSKYDLNLYCNRPHPHVGSFDHYKKQYGELCVGRNKYIIHSFILANKYEEAYCVLMDLLPRCNPDNLYNEIRIFEEFEHLNNVPICKICRLLANSVNDLHYCEDCQYEIYLYMKENPKSKAKEFGFCDMCSSIKPKNVKCKKTIYC